MLQHCQQFIFAFNFHEFDLWLWDNEVIEASGYHK